MINGVIARNVIGDTTVINVISHVQVDVILLRKDAMLIQVNAMNVMRGTMEMTVRRSVQMNVRIHVIGKQGNVERVRMAHGVHNVRTNVKKDVIIQVVILKHATLRRVNVHVKWVIIIQRVINNVVEDVIQHHQIAISTMETVIIVCLDGMVRSVIMNVVKVVTQR